MPSIFKKFCKCCKKHLTKSYFGKHLTTRKHRRNVQTSIEKRQEKEVIKDEVLTFPKEILDIIIDYKDDLEKIAEYVDICDSVNKQLEKKVRIKSNIIYSRDIKLTISIKCSELEDIMMCNISTEFEISMLYKMSTIKKTDKNKIVKRISLQWNPMVPYPSDYLYVLLH